MCLLQGGSLNILIFHYYYYYYYYYCIIVSCHRPVSLYLPGTPPLNQLRSPPLRLPVSHCRTFRIMCDVPSVAAFCSESVERFPGMTSNFLSLLLQFRWLQSLPVLSHISCSTFVLSLYFSSFSASFYVASLSAGIATLLLLLCALVYIL